jgi:hypothetical protein
VQRSALAEATAATSDFPRRRPSPLVINERECRVIGLQTGTLTQQSRNGHLNHGHQVTVAVAAAPSKSPIVRTHLLDVRTLHEAAARRRDPPLRGGVAR